jgi:hypothetical protein
MASIRDSPSDFPNQPEGRQFTGDGRSALRPDARDQRQVLGPETRESRQLRLNGDSQSETLTWVCFPADANRRALSGGVSGSFSQFGKKSEIEARHLWVTWEINS